MTDQTAAAPLFNTFKLDAPIVVGGVVLHPAGTEIKVRKPQSGELRGLQIAALLQMDYTQLETLAPRITQPMLHKQAVAAMDPADLTQFGSEVTDFLLPSGAKAASPAA